MKNSISHYHDQKDHLSSFWKRFMSSIKLVFGNKQFLLFGLAMAIISVILYIISFWTFGLSYNKVLFTILQVIINIAIIIASIITIMGGYFLIKQKDKETHITEIIGGGLNYLLKYIQAMLRILWKNVWLLVPAIVFITLAKVLNNELWILLYTITMLILGLNILGSYSFPWIFIVLKNKNPKEAVIESRKFSSTHVNKIIWQFIKMGIIAVIFLIIILIPIMGILMGLGAHVQESIVFNNIISGIITPFFGLFQVVFTWLLYLKYTSKKETK